MSISADDNAHNSIIQTKPMNNFIIPNPISIQLISDQKINCVYLSIKRCFLFIKDYAIVGEIFYSSSRKHILTRKIQVVDVDYHNKSPFLVLFYAVQMFIYLFHCH